jgi:hypothetical protein
MAHDFQLEEYKMLRSKAQETISRIEDLERNVIVASSAIFVFSVGSFQAKSKYQSLVILLLPLCVSLVGFFRYKGFASYVREINDYTIGLEKQLAGEKGGWLTYYYSEDRPIRDERYQQYRKSVWYAVIVFNLLAGMGLAIPLFYGR